MAFANSVKRNSKKFDIIIGSNSSVDGEIRSSGSIRVDGNLSGKVVSQGNVIIAANAIVIANLSASFCEVSGTVTGDIHSDSQLKILNSGSLKGDIVVSSFSIEEGGIFQGNCDINPNKKEPVKSKKNNHNKNNSTKITDNKITTK